MTIPVTVENLKQIWEHSQAIGLAHRFAELAIVWAEGATLHIQNLERGHAIERAKWQQELRDWQQRATGGMCRCLSAERCECGLCERDRQIAELRERVRTLVREVAQLAHEQREGIMPEHFTDLTPMPFGKYKGEPLGKVPAEYLDWLIGEDFLKDPRNAGLRRYILANEQSIRADLPDDD